MIRFSMAKIKCHGGKTFLNSSVGAPFRESQYYFRVFRYVTTCVVCASGVNNTAMARTLSYSIPWMLDRLTKAPLVEKQFIVTQQRGDEPHWGTQEGLLGRRMYSAGINHV
jgi:hypothetical protein